MDFPVSLEHANMGLDKGLREVAQFLGPITGKYIKAVQGDIIARGEAAQGKLSKKTGTFSSFTYIMASDFTEAHMHFYDMVKNITERPNFACDEPYVDSHIELCNDEPSPAFTTLGLKPGVR